MNRINTNDNIAALRKLRRILGVALIDTTCLHRSAECQWQWSTLEPLLPRDHKGMKTSVGIRGFPNANAQLKKTH